MTLANYLVNYSRSLGLPNRNFKLWKFSDGTFGMDSYKDGKMDCISHYMSLRGHYYFYRSRLRGIRRTEKFYIDLSISQK